MTVPLDIGRERRRLGRRRPQTHDRPPGDHPVDVGRHGAQHRAEREDDDPADDHALAAPAIAGDACEEAEEHVREEREDGDETRGRDVPAGVQDGIDLVNGLATTAVAAVAGPSPTAR